MSLAAPWFLCALAATALLAASSDRAPEKEVDDGLDVRFREVEILSTAPQAQETWGESDPGESQKLERAYPGAPPQVPHEMESMLPITLEANDCLECHLPENATEEKDVPTPKSHFERPLLGTGAAGQAMATVVRGYEAQKELLGSRYNCNTCHVAQATNIDPPAPPSTQQRAPEAEK